MSGGIFEKLGNLLRKSDSTIRTLLLLGITSITSVVTIGFLHWNWLDRGRKALGFGKNKRRKKDGAVNIGGKFFFCISLQLFGNFRLIMHS
jgi:hypothetical protein